MAKKPARKTYSNDDKGRADRFRDFAKLRVTRAIRALRAVAKLANKKSYSYTAEHVATIGKALNTELEGVANAFKGTAKAPDTFEL